MLERISDKLAGIVRQLSGKAQITEKNIQDTVNEIKIALLEADVNLRVVRRFVNQTIEEARGEGVLKSVTPGQQFIKIIHDKMVSLLGDSRQTLQLKGPDTLSTILLMGLQGSGKTTTAAKLGLALKKEGRKPMLVAADLVRPAAVEQLRVLGESVNIEVYREDDSTPQTVVKNAIAYAKKNQFNTLIIDTAGRLHVDEKMMAEIREIRVLCAPSECLLVADAMSGQQAVEVAGEFDKTVGITGVILSKFDSDARGGAALSLKSVIGKPLKYIGTGEKVDDLEPFYPERIASRILGMGDVVTLVEKAQNTIDVHEAEKLQKKLQSATFTLEDYLEQFSRLKKMGSIQSLIEMIPGARGALSEDDIDPEGMKREEAIILSMTLDERRNHRIIGPSRRRRIAKGSGTPVFEVNRLLKKFETMRLTMKKATKNKKYQAKLMSQFGA
ncbi:MAG: signal recognition particle protein [Spirochaetales bacterium]|nr:signal recognition particle protein [Spirochaetales bacterium]